MNANTHLVATSPPPAPAPNRLIWLWQNAPANTLVETGHARTTPGLIKTRTVLALAYESGDFVAQQTTFCNQPVLLLGQANSLERAARDFEELMVEQAVDFSSPKAVVPIVGSIHAGWRRQFGWMAVFEPRHADHDLVWNWLNPSIRWINERGSRATITAARQFDPKSSFRPLSRVFRDVFPVD